MTIKRENLSLVKRLDEIIRKLQEIIILSREVLASTEFDGITFSGDNDRDRFIDAANKVITKSTIAFDIITERRNELYEDE